MIQYQNQNLNSPAAPSFPVNSGAARDDKFLQYIQCYVLMAVIPTQLHPYYALIKHITRRSFRLVAEHHINKCTSVSNVSMGAFEGSLCVADAPMIWQRELSVNEHQLVDLQWHFPQAST